jgi:hypothetical protein
MAHRLKKVKLIAQAEIYLTPVGLDAESAERRFIQIFNLVWDRLPQSARDALSVKWSIASARLYLTHTWREQGRRLAQCAFGGASFHFYSPAVHRMPDSILAECIAHELAHAFFYVTRDPYHCGGLNGQVYDKILQRRLAEALTRELVTVWGFNPGSLAEWCVNNSDWLESNANGPSG